ncbi:phosphoribosylformylglycinamidine synthase [Methylophilaceae bacterium]|nr:phosphoribosylformylglycinamidine synthase [Methylophilaceae bacterium]
MQKKIISSLIGNKIYSNFRAQNLLRVIQAKYPSVIGLASTYLHIFESKENLNSVELNNLKQILDYGEKTNIPKKFNNVLFIGPRIGTISPWSSRAKDILVHCGVNINKIERLSKVFLQTDNVISKKEMILIGRIISDQMTESVFLDEKSSFQLFSNPKQKKIEYIDFLNNGKKAIEDYTKKNGLALSDEEILYLSDYYTKLNSNPTDAELMMFSQANSEHCRHKIFNASWTIEGKTQENSLFGMIRNTHKASPQKTIVAYSDNSSVIEGSKINRFYPNKSGLFQENLKLTHYIIKVETHNHPTAISPFAGAATGAGGEIRDEGATGRGSKPKAGLSGFSVSNLDIPNFKQPWEKNNIGFPERIATSLKVMIDGPIGAASYNNEFGRPNILGYFRSLETQHNGKNIGYHKPIMLAGGVGSISDNHTKKKSIADGNLLIQLGGPAMLIGLGGGAASSMNTGTNQESLDFASVQRGNPELQRRAQEVIDTCWQMDSENPILSIHDVGAGGLSNAFPELIHDGGIGAIMDIRNIHNEELAMSPKEIWSNEAQERYVLAIEKSSLEMFSSICSRERCPFAIIGEAKNQKNLIVKDSLLNEDVVNMNLDVLLGNPPKLKKNVIKPTLEQNIEHEIDENNLLESISRVLHFPSVASKNFLITIADRSVTGLVARDQMVGPWQVPVSDVGVTKSTFNSISGEAMAIGEKAPIAITNAAASARMSVAEAITNIAASAIKNINLIKLSANWMAASGENDRDYELFEAVKAVGMELCPKLGISIPVGKDSMSMQTSWNDNDLKTVTSPLSLIVSAFSETYDVNKTLTPQLNLEKTSSLILIDLGNSKNRMGGSCFNSTNNISGGVTPDLDDPSLIKNFFIGIQNLNKKNKILAYHDRSDGGLITTILEMAFAGHCGIDLNLKVKDEIFKFLFNEELGAVIQILNDDVIEILKYFNNELDLRAQIIGAPNNNQSIKIYNESNLIVESSRGKLQQDWAETSYKIQSIRDNPKTAKEEFDLILDDSYEGIQPKINFDIPKSVNIKKTKPKIAILREQGINGQSEMAAAFNYAGFNAFDVHMAELSNGVKNLRDFQGLAACGGFSYGDVLGAGRGWANSILFNEKVRDLFIQFFERNNTIALGVCNGCQMMSHIKKIIPGADLWPTFIKNESEQFEARFLSVEVKKNNSLFFDGMEGSIVPVVVSHGEGRASFSDDNNLIEMLKNEQITLKFDDKNGTLSYPNNPNGSIESITGMSSDNGRFTIMMPHPERNFRADQNSWRPKNWEEFGPWYRMFANANKYFN